MAPRPALPPVRPRRSTGGCRASSESRPRRRLRCGGSPRRRKLYPNSPAAQIEQLLGLDRDVPVAGAVIAVSDEARARLGDDRLDRARRKPPSLRDMDSNDFHEQSLRAGRRPPLSPLPGEHHETSELRIRTDLIRGVGHPPEPPIIGSPLCLLNRLSRPMPTHTGVLLYWSRRVRVTSAAIAVALLVLLGGDVASTTPPSAPPSAEWPAPRWPCPPRSRLLPARHAEGLPPTGRPRTSTRPTRVRRRPHRNPRRRHDGQRRRQADPGRPDTATARRGSRPSQLGYGRTYTMTIAGRGPGGMPTRQTSSFTTVTPSDQTQVYFNTTGGDLLQDGGTYGVGMVSSPTSTSRSPTRPTPSGT